MAGLRVGFAIARRETLADMEPYRPPGSVATTSVTVVTEALRTPGLLAANLARVQRERRRVTDGLVAAGWKVGPSVTNFLLIDLESAERAGRVAEGLLRRGLVPRTFGPTHPLASHLRLTIRDRDDDDLLITAAHDLAAQEATR
jgi:histidinol-phosphate/aromatic aminotransferase/cobyric acid decarboxylase-like protein